MSIATMIVHLIARTDQYEKGMDRAHQKTRTFEQSIKSFDKRLMFAAKAGGLTFLAQAAMDGFSAYQDAARKGENTTVAWTDAILKNVPFAGAAIVKFTDEISGLATAQQHLKTISASSDFIKKTAMGYDKQLSLMGTSPQLRYQEQARQWLEEQKTQRSEQYALLKRDYAIAKSKAPQGQVYGRYVYDTTKEMKDIEQQMFALKKLGDVAERVYKEKLIEPAKQLTSDVEEQLRVYESWPSKIALGSAAMANATAEERARLKALYAELRVKEQITLRNKLLADEQSTHMSYAESMYNSTKNPWEEYQDKIESLNDAYKQGVVNAKTYWRAVAGYGADFLNAIPKRPRSSLGAGSAELLANNVSVAGLRTNAKLKEPELLQQLIDKQTEANRYLYKLQSIGWSN